MPPFPEVAMIGKTVAHYRILAKLGEGGMGAVYLAEDTRLDRRVALKVLPAEVAGDADRLARFEREAKALAALNHPNIVTIYSVEEADGVRFLTMEHVRGEQLGRSVPRGGLPLGRLFEIALPLVDAVSAAHKQGITHRDLKPDNVMLDEEGRVKVLDFGLAKLQDPVGGDDAATRLRTHPVTGAGKVLGTTPYMSPEQAEGKPVDHRSDIFALGILLYMLSTGERPFRGDTPVSIVSSILKDDPPPVTDLNASLPRDLGRIIKRCLAKRPDDRFESAGGLRSELVALREEIVSGGHERGAAAARPPAWRRPGALLGLGVLAAAAAAVIFARGHLGGASPAEGPGPTAIGASGRPAVAVLPFDDLTASQDAAWLSDGVPSMVLTGLAQISGLDVVSGSRVREILRQVGGDHVRADDESVMTEVARRSGAGAVVVGSIFKTGDEIRIDAQVEDIGTGRILTAHSVRGRDVFPLVDELTASIRDGLDLRVSAPVPGIADVTTASIEAYRLYEEGVTAARNVRTADAHQLLSRALEVDPSFAMAAFELWKVERNLDTARAREYLDLTLRNLDRLPERQRLWVRAENAVLELAQPEQARALLEELISRYPDDEDAYDTLAGLWRIDFGDPRAEMEVLERGVRACPASGPLRNHYAYSLVERGRYAEALEQLEAYRQLNPDEPNPLDSVGDVYLMTGRPEKAIEMYDRAMKIDPGFFNAQSGRAYSFAVLGRYDEALAASSLLHDAAKERSLPDIYSPLLTATLLSRVGRYEEARREIALEDSTCRSLGQVRVLVLAQLLEATVAIETGDAGHAIEVTADALPLLDDVHDPGARAGLPFLVRYVAGRAELRAGNPAEARRLLDEQKSLYASLDESARDSYLSVRWWHSALAGETALAEGDLEGAERAFRTGEPEYKMTLSRGLIGPTLFSNCLSSQDGRARVREARGDLDGAIEMYRALIEPDIRSKWIAFLEPRYVLALARLYDRKGDAEEARREYRRFLDLWKDADPGLPETAEAKGYLAKTSSSPGDAGGG